MTSKLICSSYQPTGEKRIRLVNLKVILIPYRIFFYFSLNVCRFAHQLTDIATRQRYFFQAQILAVYVRSALLTVPPMSSASNHKWFTRRLVNTLLFGICSLATGFLFFEIYFICQCTLNPDQKVLSNTYLTQQLPRLWQGSPTLLTKAFSNLNPFLAVLGLQR